MGNRVACPECGEEYERLGRHWFHSPSHRPDFTERQKDIIIGSLMGDGYLDRDNKNSRIKWKMISQNYLEWVDDIFGCLSTGVSIEKTAEELAKQNRDNFFDPNTRGEKYSDLYVLTTRSHPFLNNFNSWYETGKRVWPNDIELTPTVLLHWYVQDGNWRNRGGSNHIKFTASKEYGNYDKLDSYFENVNIPTPNNYKEYERSDGRKKLDIRFTVEQSKELWDYMLNGPRQTPPPDFEYKFPERYHE